MKYLNYFILGFTFLLLCSCNQGDNKGWKPAKSDHIKRAPHVGSPKLSSFVTKTEGNIKYTLSAKKDMEERDEIVANIQRYIAECLEIVNETEFNDSLHITLFADRDEFDKYIGFPFAGMAGLKNDDWIDENYIFCVYKKDYHPLKHEIMHIINFTQWGDSDGVPQLLVEGLPTFADPEHYDCDGLTLEERYVYLLQTGRLLESKDLMRFPENSEVPAAGKIGYNQSGYIMGYLYDNYGIENIKMLWIESKKDDMETQRKTEIKRKEENIAPNDYEKWRKISVTYSYEAFSSIFEKTYGITFDSMIEKINNELNEKYAQPIDMDWEKFKNECS